MSAKDVFTAVIRHLRNEVIQHLETHGPLINEGDIQWVLTCSKFSPEDCRTFMKECAKEVRLYECAIVEKLVKINRYH